MAAWSSGPEHRLRGLRPATCRDGRWSAVRSQCLPQCWARRSQRWILRQRRILLSPCRYWNARALVRHSSHPGGRTGHHRRCTPTLLAVWTRAMRPLRRSGLRAGAASWGKTSCVSTRWNHRTCAFPAAWLEARPEAQALPVILRSDGGRAQLGVSHHETTARSHRRIPTRRKRLDNGTTSFA